MPNEPGKQPAIRTRKHVARLERERQQSKIILYTFIGILASVMLLLLYGYLDVNYFQLQRPVAKVGDTEILANQFEPRVRMQRSQLLSQYSQTQQYGQVFGMDVTSQLSSIENQLNSPETVGQQVLDQMINEALIRLEAHKRGITVSDEELNTAKQSSFNFYPNGTPTPTNTPTPFVTPENPKEAYKVVTITPVPTNTALVTGTPEGTATEIPATPTATFAPAPTATQGPTSTPFPTATAYTSEGFEKEFQNGMDRMAEFGLKKADYLAFFDFQVLEQKLKEQITADVKPVEEQVWARHILVADQAVALTMIERLKSGDDFAELAREFSTDTGSAERGGDLGWFGRGMMVSEFETAAYALEKPGDYTTTPVATSFGYHVIQLIAKQERPLSSTQVESAKNQVFSDWLTSAREEYGVEIFDIWKEHIPAEPNFITIATDVAKSAKSTREAAAEATAKP